MSAKDDPAFPRVVHTGMENVYYGLSARDCFAAKAMAALICSPLATQKWIKECAVASAYQIADAMLAERSKS